MVKTYPKCPEAGMNVDLGCYNVMKYIPFLVPEGFYWLIFNAIATTLCFQRHSAPFLHLYFFCGSVITPLVPILFMESKSHVK